MTPTLQRSSLIAVLLMAWSGAAVAAQEIESPYRFVESTQEAGLFTGIASMGTGRFGYAPGSGIVLGARYGIDFSGPLTFEVVASAVSGTRDVIDPGRVEGDRKVGEANFLVGAVDGRVKLTLTGRSTWHGISPFVLFGGGMAFDLAGAQAADKALPPEDRFDFGKSFFGTLGSGVRWLPVPSFTVRLDGIFSLWKVKTPIGFAQSERGFENVARSEWLQGVRLTLGAALRF